MFSNLLGLIKKQYEETKDLRLIRAIDYISSIECDKRKKDKYIYVHLMNHSVYNKKMINRMFDRDIHNKDSCEHFFISPGKEILLGDNFFYFEEPNQILPMLTCADVIIVQYLFPYYIPLLLNQKVTAKIIWLPWAGDYISQTDIQLYDDLDYEFFSLLNYNIDVRKIDKKVFSALLSRIDLFFCATAVHDLLASISNEKELPYLPYFFHQDIIEDILPKNRLNNANPEKKQVILGNSLSPTNNYIAALHELAKYKDTIQISLMMSYGNDDRYKKIIKSLAYDLFGSDARFIEDFFSPSDFLYFASCHDICVMYHNRLQGMGAITVYLSQGLNVYLKEENLCWGLLDSISYPIKGLYAIQNGVVDLNRDSLDVKDTLFNQRYLFQAIQESDERLMSLLYP